MSPSPSPLGGAAAVAAVLVALVALPGFSSAVVYKVGGSVGWTTLGNPNYTAWAISKTFHVGDVLLFEYRKEVHNVMLVTREDYRSCNAGAPLATYTTGNDSIPITTDKHHYFLCGVPTHCAKGQKVDVRVLPGTSSAAPSTSPAPTPGGAGGSASAPSNAPSVMIEGLGLYLALAGTAAVSVLILS